MHVLPYVRAGRLVWLQGVLLPYINCCASPMPSGWGEAASLPRATGAVDCQEQGATIGPLSTRTHTPPHPHPTPPHHPPHPPRHPPLKHSRPPHHHQPTNLTPPHTLPLPHKGVQMPHAPAHRARVGMQGVLPTLNSFHPQPACPCPPRSGWDIGFYPTPINPKLQPACPCAPSTGWSAASSHRGFDTRWAPAVHRSAAGACQVGGKP